MGGSARDAVLQKACVLHNSQGRSFDLRALRALGGWGGKPGHFAAHRLKLVQLVNLPHRPLAHLDTSFLIKCYRLSPGPCLAVHASPEARALLGQFGGK